MTYTTYTTLLQDAKAATDYPTFVESHPATPEKTLLQIWHMRTDTSTRSIMQATYTDCPFWRNRYGIPYDTIRSWRKGNNTPPDYLLHLITTDLLTDQNGIELTYTDVTQYMAAAKSCDTAEELITLYDTTADKKILRDLWELSKDPSLPTLMCLTNANRATLHQTYSLPVRTIEAWCAKINSPKDYILRFLATDLLKEAYCT